MNGVGAERGERDGVVCVGESEIGSFRCCVGAWRSMMRPTTKKPHAERKREREGGRYTKPSKKESKEHNVKSVCRWLSVLFLLFCVVPSTPRTSPQHQICMYRLPTAFSVSSIHSFTPFAFACVRSLGRGRLCGWICGSHRDASRWAACFCSLLVPSYSFCVGDPFPAAPAAAKPAADSTSPTAPPTPVG